MTTLVHDCPNGPTWPASNNKEKNTYFSRSYMDGKTVPFGPGTKYPNVGAPRPEPPVVGKTSNGDLLHHASIKSDGTAKPFNSTEHFGPTDHHEAIEAYTKAGSKAKTAAEGQKHYAMVAHHAQALAGMAGEMAAGQSLKPLSAPKPPALPKTPKIGKELNMTTLAHDYPNGPSGLAEHLELQLLAKAAKKGEGSRGGKIIGHTRSGKPIYHHSAPQYQRARDMGRPSARTDDGLMQATMESGAHYDKMFPSYDFEDHEDASDLHGKKLSGYNKASDRHEAAQASLAHHDVIFRKLAAGWRPK